MLVRQADVSGNTSATGALTFTLDTAAAAPSLALATDSGSSGSDRITSSGVVNVAGLEFGAGWAYSTDNGATYTAGTGTSFSLTGDGAKSVLVRQTDTAGNISATGALTFTFDTGVLPCRPSPDPANGSTIATATPTITGTGEAGADGHDTRSTAPSRNRDGPRRQHLELHAVDAVVERRAHRHGDRDRRRRQRLRRIRRLTPLLANTAVPVSDGCAGAGYREGAADGITSNPALTGTSDAGAAITLTEGAVTLGTATANAGGMWSFTPSGLDCRRAHDRRQRTAPSLVGSLTFTLDTAAALAPSMALAIDSGSSGSDRITSAGVVNVTGLESLGAAWAYSTDSGATYTAGTGTSFTLTGDGAKSVLVRQTDVAGNISATGALAFTLDTAASSAPALALATDSGSSGSDRITSSGTVSVTGLESVPPGPTRPTMARPTRPEPAPASR